MNLYGLLVPVKLQHLNKLKKFMNIYEKLSKKMLLLTSRNKSVLSTEVTIFCRIIQINISLRFNNRFSYWIKLQGIGSTSRYRRFSCRRFVIFIDYYQNTLSLCLLGASLKPEFEQICKARQN
jgi:hypothetical protein